VVQDDLGVGVAHHAGGGDVVVLLHGEDLRAHDTRVFGDGDEADGDDGLFKAAAKGGHEGDGEQDRGDCQHHVHDAHDHGVHHAALVAGDGAQGHADYQRDRHGQQTARERDLRTHEHAGKEVAAVHVGAEPVLRRGRQHGVGQDLLVGVVGQDRGNKGGDDRLHHQEDDEDETDHRELVRLERGPHAAPQGLGLLDVRVAGVARLQRLGTRTGEVLLEGTDGALLTVLVGGDVGCHLGIHLCHLHHPSSFA